MKRSFIQMIFLSVRRRRRSLWKVALISFLCVFLFAGIMIFQDCMNRFQRENAFLRSGEWILSTEGNADFVEEHAWIDYRGEVTTRTEGYSNPKSFKNIRREGYIGTVDDNFWKLSHLEMYSGALPQKEDEIAITQHVLSDMGCSYELGQKITINYTDGTINANGMPVFYELHYTLSGVIKNYTSDWVEVENLPEFFVVPEGFNQITHVTENTTRNFYHLDRRQYDINGEKFYGAMSRLADKNSDEFYNMVYNSNAYDVTMWGSRSMYLIMMSLCGMLGGMSLIYLFLMCCNNRRPYYFKLRELGAGSGQVRGMLCLEWSAVFFPSALAGMVIAAIFSVAVAAVISRRFGIPFVFHLTGESVGMILLYTLGVFIVVMVWCCLFFRVQGLHEMTGKIPVRRLKHMLRKRDQKKEVTALFLKRQKRAEPGKTAAQTLFTIVTMTVFIYSLYMIQQSYNQYEVSESRSDMVVSVPQNGGGGMNTIQLWRDSSGSDILKDKEIVTNVEIDIGEKKVDYGMENEILEKLEQVEGVEDISGVVSGREFFLKWEGQEKSTFRQNWYLIRYVDSAAKSLADSLRETAADDEAAWQEYNKAYAYIPEGGWWNNLIPENSSYGSVFQESLYGIEKTQQMEHLLRRKLGRAFHSEEFWSGEQSLLFALEPAEDTSYEDAPDLRYDSAYKKPLQGKLEYDQTEKKYRFSCQQGVDYIYDYTEDSLKTGDKITICNNHLIDLEKQKAEILELAETKVILSSDIEVFRDLLYAMTGSSEADMLFDLEGGYYLFSSEELIRQLAEKLGKVCRYDTLRINLQKGGNIKETEAKVTDLISQFGNDIYYTNYIQDKSQKQNDFYQKLGIFGIVLALTGAVYIFICQSMQRKSMELSQKRIQLFIQSGCSRDNLAKGYGAARFREGAWGFVGIPLCPLVIAAGEIIRYVRECKREGWELDWQVPGYTIQNNVADYVNGISIWLIFLVFWILCNGLCVWAAGKYLRNIQMMEKEE